MRALRALGARSRLRSYRRARASLASSSTNGAPTSKPARRKRKSGGAAVAKKTSKELVRRDETPRADNTASGLKILSWNVAGLRGLLRNPDRLGQLQRLVSIEKPDVLCLQETKLQPMHVDPVSAELEEATGFHGHWSCSITRKGYSGTAVLRPRGADMPLGLPEPTFSEPEGQGEAGDEGRAIEARFESELTLLNLYTPNSGTELARIDYRLNGWDAWLRAYATDGSADRPGLVVCGDMNVAHMDADFFAPTSKAYLTSPGTTPEERKSFGRLLDECDLVDTFRAFHPTAQGVFSYWSQRARNRAWNRGMRLDYFIAERGLLGGGAEKKDSSNGRLAVVDSFVLDNVILGGSDHAPGGIVVQRL